MTKPRATWVLWVKYDCSRDTPDTFKGWCKSFSVTPEDWYCMTGKKIIQEYIDKTGWTNPYRILPAGRTPK